MGKYIEDLALRFIRETKLGPEALEWRNPPSSSDMNPHWFYRSVKEKLQAWFKKKRTKPNTSTNGSTRGSSTRRRGGGGWSWWIGGPSSGR